MSVYYKFSREPVSSTISTPWCGDQEKTAVPSIEIVHEKVRSGCSTYLFLFF